MLTRWDRAVVEAFQDLHWGPADWVFVQLSGWWVKSLVIIGIGLVAEPLVAGSRSGRCSPLCRTESQPCWPTS